MLQNQFCSCCCLSFKSVVVHFFFYLCILTYLFCIHFVFNLFTALCVAHVSQLYFTGRELDFFVLCCLSVLLFCLSFLNGDAPSTAEQIYLQVFIKFPDLTGLQPCGLCDPASTIQY